jgi:hypothetical protein
VNSATNEKYIKGNWTNFNATDKVRVIGRFNCILGVGTSYNWTAPASAVIVNESVYVTRSLSYTPTCTGFSSYSAVGRYRVSNDCCEVWILYIEGTSGSVNFTVKAPFTARALSGSQCWIAYSRGKNNSADLATPTMWELIQGASTFTVYTTPALGLWTATGTKGARGMKVNVEI